jgi:hypothetical protein
MGNVLFGKTAGCPAGWAAGFRPVNVGRLQSAFIRGNQLCPTTRLTDATTTTAVLDVQVQQLLAHAKAVAAGLPHKAAFRLERANSTVAIGEGVFAAGGTIQPGIAVAFFPGLCYPAPPGVEAASELHGTRFQQIITRGCHRFPHMRA